MGFGNLMSSVKRVGVHVSFYCFNKETTFLIYSFLLLSVWCVRSAFSHYFIAQHKNLVTFICNFNMIF